MDKLFGWGRPSLELYGKKIELNGVTSLTVDDAELEKDGDKPSKYGAYHYSLTFELSTNDANPFATWYRKQCKIGREQKKALLYAVTHGYKVVIPFNDDDGEDKCIVPLTPRVVRGIYRKISWIPRLLILDKQYCPCNIRHGRLVRKKEVWPFAQNEIEKYTKKLISYDIRKS